jgi:hypothetical protein
MFKSIVVLFINIGLTSAFSKKYFNRHFKIKPYDPLRSCQSLIIFLAIVPGLGQVYNKQY